MNNRDVNEEVYDYGVYPPRLTHVLSIENYERNVLEARSTCRLITPEEGFTYLLYAKFFYKLLTRKKWWEFWR